MKTLLNSNNTYALLLLCSMLLFFSCEKKEGLSPVNPMELVLTASATDIDKGDEVTFKVTVDGEAVDAEIYINNSKISGITHAFEAGGTFQVIAKKEGYKDSKNIAIKAYTVDVYISGVGNIGRKRIAKYWKNGTPIELSDDGLGSVANGIVVSEGDVYVVGNSTQRFGTAAVYWKNGTRVSMTKSGEISHGRAIAVENGNVYIAGSKEELRKDKPTYWKNGSPVKLADAGTAIGIAVDDGVVRVVGSGYEHPNYFANYWKDGTRISLTKGNENMQAHAVTVDKGDVYVAGIAFADFSYRVTRSKAVYWKNGTPVTLGENVTTSDIVLDNGDVYVAGTDYTINVAQYWKNGKLVVLTDKQHNADAISIAVNNGDVYVAGNERSVAKYWKNGTSVTLEDSDYTRATSIFVVRTLGGD